MSELDNLNGKSKWGGKRDGAGRTEGSKNKATIEKQIAETEFKNRILLNIQELLNAQLNIAKGASYLFRIDEEKSSKGTVLSKKHRLVEDPTEIKEVLDEVEGTGVVDDKYYYITTKAPDNKALDSLINRVFGTATYKQDITSGDKPIAILGGITVKEDEKE